MKSLHFQCRPATKKENGPSVFRIGAAFGYWPCVKGPFVQIAVGFYVWDFWYGLKGYKKETNGGFKSMSTQFRMEYEGKMVTVEELAAIRRKRCNAFAVRPGKIPPKLVKLVPVPPYRVELVWNREFDFRRYGGSTENLKVATTLADDLLNMGDGAEVKKTRVVDSEGQIVYAYGKLTTWKH